MNFEYDEKQVCIKIVNNFNPSNGENEKSYSCLSLNREVLNRVKFLYEKCVELDVRSIAENLNPEFLQTFDKVPVPDGEPKLILFDLDEDEPEYLELEESLVNNDSVPTRMVTLKIHKSNCIEIEAINRYTGEVYTTDLIYLKTIEEFLNTTEEQALKLAPDSSLITRGLSKETAPLHVNNDMLYIKKIVERLLKEI